MSSPLLDDLVALEESLSKALASREPLDDSRESNSSHNSAGTAASLTSSSVEFSPFENFALSQSPSLQHSSHSPLHFTALSLAEESYRMPPCLYAGTSQGSLHRWVLENLNKFGGKSKSRTATRFPSTHSGPITAIAAPIPRTVDHPRLIFTAGADGRLKIHLFDTTLLQTVSAHTSTVTAIHPTALGVVTASVDQTLKVWTPEDGRVVMLHPFYVLTKTLKPSSGPHLSSSASGWTTCITGREGEDWVMYGSDSEGSISVYRPDTSPNGPIRLSKKWGSVHRLGITNLTLVSSQNFLVTTSYDQTCQVLDAMTGNIFMTIEGKNRCRYTGSCWDPTFEQLVLCDALGNLEAHNVYVERKVGTDSVSSNSQPKGQGVLAGGGAALMAAKNQKPSKKTSSDAITASTPDPVKITAPVVQDMIWAGNDRFIMMFPAQARLQEWGVKRNLACTQFKGHDDAVIGIVVINDETSSSSSASSTLSSTRFRPEESALFSAGLDNQIKCWDDYDISQRFKLSERDTEISCIAHVSSVNLVVTGNDDGTVKFWNPDSGHCHVEHCHSNTVTSIEIANTDRHELVISSSFDGSMCVFDVGKKKLGAASYLDFRMVEEESDDDEGNDNTPEEKKANQDEKQESYLNPSAIPASLRVGLDDNKEILCIHYHFESGALISAGNDGLLRAWDTLSGNIICKWESGHSGSVTCITGDGSTLFSGGEDGVVAVWNLAGNTLNQSSRTVHGKTLTSRMRRLSSIQACKDASVHDLIITPHTGFLVAALGDGNVRVWDYATGDEVKNVRHHDEVPNCLAGKTGGVFVGTAEGSLLRFNIDSLWREKRSLRREKKRLFDVQTAIEEEKDRIENERKSGKMKALSQKLS